MSNEVDADSVVRMGSDEELPCGAGRPLGSVEHRRVEAWLSALLQSEHLALLVGNGLSAAVGHLAGTSPPSMSRPLSDSPTGALANVQSHARSSARGLGRDANLEDEIRSAMLLADGLAVLGKDEDEEEVREAVESAMSRLLDEVLEFERGLWDEHQSATHKAKDVARALLRFLSPFVSRPVQRDRLNLFTTNYDRLLEYSADLLGLRLIDRFEGQLHPRFTASRINLDVHYSPPGVRGEPRLVDGVVRYAKLHGSVDWQFTNQEILRAPLPFGGSVGGTGTARGAVIYPNPAKDVETLAYPYAELFRDFAAAICRPNTVLVTFGYGFGDGHINRVIADMLRLPSTHLVVISRDRLATLDAFKQRTLYPEGQTTELIGPAVGSLAEFSDFLPSLTPDRVLDAQFDYLDRRARLDDALAVDVTDHAGRSED
jgi:hypothetical protein